MGTPEFAVGALEAIHQSHHEVLAVVTAPDKPAGRGLKLKASEVKEYALAHQLPVLQPEKLRDENFLSGRDIKKPLNLKEELTREIKKQERLWEKKD